MFSAQIYFGSELYSLFKVLKDIRVFGSDLYKKE